MNSHPAQTMLQVWITCTLAFYLLPYQLTERQLAWQGTLLFWLFIAAFIAGACMIACPRSVGATAQPVRFDARRAERWLSAAATLTCLFFVLDAQGKDLFDLAVAYELRSETADALLKGEASNSSVWFQLAFLLYPAAYVYLAVHAIYAPRVQVWRLVAFGLLPIGLATMNMGGRVPIFYAVLVIWLSLRQRSRAGHAPSKPLPRAQSRRFFILLACVALGALMAYYFASVFIVRAAVVGGTSEMFLVAEDRWGISFRGLGSGLMFAALGDDLTYLVFVFIWYLVQGLVMGNYLFSLYDGPLQLGIYGIDLMSAVMRRVDPARVAEGFDSLLSLGTYGFLPSAWGSLFVDFSYAGALPCMIWGALATLTYRRIACEHRTDWLVFGPFVTLGILFSVINTPLGFTNGFVTHAWMLAAFFMLRRQRQPAVQAASPDFPRATPESPRLA